MPTASEGTSSDSCVPFSAGAPQGLSGRLAAQGLLGAGCPLRLASPLLGTQSATLVLQRPGALAGAALLPVSFQEGRRASDTSLTQGEWPPPPPPGGTTGTAESARGSRCQLSLPAGLKAFRQLRKSTRAKGLLGLNKIKGLARHVCLSTSSSRASRAGLSPLQPPPPSPGLLEAVLRQQRCAPFPPPSPPPPSRLWGAVGGVPGPRVPATR